MPNDKKKNEIIPKLDSKKPLKHIQNKYVEILVSVGHGLNGGKKIDSEETLNEKLLRELKKHQPKHIIINVADRLQRWNYFEMVKHLSAQELKTRLQDIPDDVNEKKLVQLFANMFADIAENLGKEYTNNLKKHFEDTKITTGLNIPLTIKRWDERKSTNNYIEHNTESTEPDSNNDNNFENKLEETKKRFLANKKKTIEDAIAQITKAQPKLATLNWDEITSEACKEYINEEKKYFGCLTDTDVIYPAKIPPALEPIFEKKELNLYWREVDFKKRSLEKMQEELQKLSETMGKTADQAKQPSIEQTNNNHELARALPISAVLTPRLFRTQSTSVMDRKSYTKDILSESLAKRRSKFFAPLDTQNASTNSINSPIWEIKSPDRTIVINAAKPISPKSEQKLLAFINLFCKSPLSPEKDQALQQKLEEAAALLSVPS